MDPGAGAHDLPRLPAVHLSHRVSKGPGCVDDGLGADSEGVAGDLIPHHRPAHLQSRHISVHNTQYTVCSPHYHLSSLGFDQVRHGGVVGDGRAQPGGGDGDTAVSEVQLTLDRQGGT